jgi:hypothetical protein
VRQILFDRHGDAAMYLTGAGVAYTVENEPVGRLQDGVLLGYQGDVLGYLEDGLLWNRAGEVVAFVKGAKAQGGLELPPTKKLTQRLTPRPAPFFPLLRPHAKPELRWRWADEPLASYLSRASYRV